MKEKKTVYPQLLIDGWNPGHVLYSGARHEGKTGEIEYLGNDVYLLLEPVEIEIEVPDYKAERDKYLASSKDSEIKKLEAKLAELKAVS